MRHDRGSEPYGARRAARSLPLLLATALALGGCTLGPERSPPPSPTPTATAPDTVDRVVVADLVGALAQALPPRETTVQVIDRDDSALVVVSEALFDEGFGVQRVKADQGAYFVDYSRETAPHEDGTGLGGRLSVGPIELRRDYLITRAGEVRTASPLRVSGTRAPMGEAAAEGVASGDRSAGEAPGTGVSDPERPMLVVADPAHRRVEYVAGTSLEGQRPIISLVTPEVVERVAQEAARGSTNGPSLQALNTSRVEINNLFYGGGSNFGSVLDDYERVARRIVVFADDSLHLGPDNKRLLEDFVENLVRDDDLIGLIGCSNGPTALEIGNEGLALGRAQRVTEELTARGIPPERIYDEGCWAPVSAGDEFPGRGVVLELWRSPV